MNTSETNIENQVAVQTIEQYTVGSVTSKDGTTIGYRQIGRGPGLILVQGAMGTAQNFTQLGQALADTFTVYVPDRRGRGLSGPSSGDSGVQKEVEDIQAMLVKTNACFIFGLSSGVIISLQALLSLRPIRKAAIYEPPLFVHGAPTALMIRYEKEMAEGRLAAALVTALQATQMGPQVSNVMPRWLLELLTDKAMVSQDKKAKIGDVTMRMLAPTLHNDFQIVAGMHGALERFQNIRVQVLLLGGSESPKFLKVDLDALEKILPHVTRVEFRGLGHSAAWNFDKQTNPHGNPIAVAQELQRFFA